MDPFAVGNVEAMRPRVVALLPPGTTVTGPFAINRLDWWRESEPVAPADRRPEVFGDADGPVGTGQKAKLVATTLFWGDENAPKNGPKNICDDPNKREKFKRRKRGFWGGWGSLAGQLETAIQPRSRWWYVYSFLVLTPDGLQVFYAPSAEMPPLTSQMKAPRPAGTARALNWHGSVAKRRRSSSSSASPTDPGRLSIFPIRRRSPHRCRASFRLAHPGRRRRALGRSRAHWRPRLDPTEQPVPQQPDGPDHPDHRSGMSPGPPTQAMQPPPYAPQEAEEPPPPKPVRDVFG